MPNATVGANARALPKSAKTAPKREYLRQLYRPGVRERGLKIVAKAQDEALAKKIVAKVQDGALDAPTPEGTPAGEYGRLVAAKCIADARLEVADEQRKTAAEAKAEQPKLEASRAFAQAHHEWLKAKAALEDPEFDDEVMSERFATESAAERSLFTTPAAYPDQWLQKFLAFETVLVDELVSGQRSDSILMLALGSLKADILNLDLCEGGR
jgi:hypothetical protein